MQNLCFRSIKKLKQEIFMLENENKYQKNLRKTIFSLHNNASWRCCLRSWSWCWIPIVEMNISITAPPSYGRGVGTLCVVWNVIWDYHNKMLASQKVGGSQLLGNICQADVTIKF